MKKIISFLIALGFFATVTTAFAAQGDILFGSANPAINNRLSIGASSTCLLSNGSVPLWGSTCGSGGSGTNYFSNSGATTTLTTGSVLLAKTIVATSSVMSPFFVGTSSTQSSSFGTGGAEVTVGQGLVVAPSIFGTDTGSGLSLSPGGNFGSVTNTGAYTDGTLSAGTPGQILEAVSGPATQWVATSSLGFSGTNFFTNVSASTSLTTGSNLLAGTGTFGSVIATGTLRAIGQTTIATASSTGLTVTATSTLSGIRLTNLTKTFLAVDSSGNVIATTTPSGGGGSIGGSIAASQIAFGSGSNAIEGTSNATLDSSGNAFFNGNSTVGGSVVVNTLESPSDSDTYLRYTEQSGIINQIQIGDISGLYGGTLYDFGDQNFSDDTGTFALGGGDLSLGGLGPGVNGRIDIYDNANNFSEIKSLGSSLFFGTPTGNQVIFDSNANITGQNIIATGTLAVTGKTTLANASSTGLTVTATSTLTGIKLTNLTSTFLAVDANHNVIATTTPSGGTNYFTNSSATTSLSTGSILTAGVGTFGTIIATGTLTAHQINYPNGAAMVNSSSQIFYSLGDPLTDSSENLYAQLGINANGSFGTAGMVLQSGGSGGNAKWVATSSLGISGGSGNSAFTIGNGQIHNATTSDMVGIGSSTPIATLSVQGSTTAPTRDLFDVASSSGANIFSIQPGGNLVGSGSMFLANNNQFSITGNGGNSLSLSLDSSNNAKLNDTVGFSGIAIQTNSGAITLNTGGTASLTVLSGGNASLNNITTIQSSGNVGVGTSTPASVLDVNGNITDESVPSCTNGLITAATGTIQCSILPVSIATTSNYIGLTAGKNLGSFVTGAATSSVEIGGYIKVRSVSVDVVSFGVSYVDENGNSQAYFVAPSGATSVSIATTGLYNFPQMQLRVAPSTTVLVQAVLTTGTGSITYDSGDNIKLISAN